MKTVTELAQEWVKKSPGFSCTCDQCTNQMIYGAFTEGYKAAEENRWAGSVKATYNEHKLKEAQETITKLKERLKLLSLEFSRIMETTEEVKDLFDGWKKTDLQFEHHDKVGPWAGLFPVKKDDV
jgi:hypothetical protein